MHMWEEIKLDKSKMIEVLERKKTESVAFSAGTKNKRREEDSLAPR